MPSPLHSIALSLLPRLNRMQLHELCKKAGSASAVVENFRSIGDLIPDISPKMADTLAVIPSLLARAEEELRWAEAKGISVITLDDDRYPQRLRECPDAPIVLYYRGTADLNQRRIVSIIGTRNITAYGRDVIEQLVADLQRECPDILVVSGLAYGVDICAHREALRQRIPTVGVVAHGLDQIYPRLHRETAVEMVSAGGLLTEYPSQTKIDKRNFVERNRIVAGMADATILVESAERGGGLITLKMAQDYNRSTFAFPGSVKAPYSAGCNNAIRDNVAQLITSADDLLTFMDWKQDSLLAAAKSQGIERQLFPDLTPEERLLVDALQSGDLQANQLSEATCLPSSAIAAQLFSLEMRGVVRLLAGGRYHLI